MAAIDLRSGDEPIEETAHAPSVPGGVDMWAFVLFEALVFCSYFCVYLFLRTQHQQEFLEAQSALRLPLGVIDTVVLLTSSWLIAAVVREARAGRFERARSLAIGATVFGVLFSALKIAEWVHLIQEGHTFTSSDFMQHFFFLTGMHAVHLIVGFVALGIAIAELSLPQQRSVARVESCATYWHTVDLFWVLIFSVLYIVR